MTATLPMTEADLQRAVVALAKLQGWRVAFFRPATVRSGRTITPVGADGAGWPDLVLVRGKHLLFAELKQDGKYPSTTQREWHAALAAAGHPVHVWKPKQWHDGTVGLALE